MKRILTIAAVAAVALLAGCTTTPKSDHLQAQLDLYKAKIEFERDVAKIRADADTTFVVAMTKIALSTDSDFAKGMISGAVGTRMGGAQGVTAQSPTAGTPVVQAPQERDWLDRTLQVGNFALNLVGMGQNYSLAKKQMSYDFDKYGLTLGALDSMAGYGFQAASEGIGYVAAKPTFFSVPAGSVQVGE